MACWNPWQALGAFQQKQSNPRSLQWVSGLLEDAHISPSPLLSQRREDGGRQTAYEANEPEAQRIFTRRSEADG